MADPAHFDSGTAIAGATAIAVAPALSDYGLIFVFALLGSLVAVSRIEGAVLTNRKGASVIASGIGLGMALSWIGSMYLGNKFHDWGLDYLNATQCLIPVAIGLGYFGHKLLGLADRKADRVIARAEGKPDA